MHKGRQRHTDPPGQKNYHAQPSSNFCLCVAGTRIKEFLPLPLMLCVHLCPHDIPGVVPSPALPVCVQLDPIPMCFPDPHVLSHLLLHFCAEPQAPTQGLSHPPWQMLDVSPGCPAQKCCLQTSYVWGETDAVICAFSFCLLSKEELRAASSQVLQGRSSRSSSQGPGGISTLTAQTVPATCELLNRTALSLTPLSG